MPVHPIVLPTFSSIRFNVSGFMLRSLIHLDLSFVHGDRYGFIFILPHVDIQLCQHYMLNMLFFPFDIFYFFIKYRMFKDVWIDIRVLCSVPLVLLSVLMPIPGCVQYCNSVAEYKVRDCDASRNSFIPQDCFGSPGIFAFPNEVEHRSFEAFEEFCWDFAGHCVESVDCF